MRKSMKNLSKDSGSGKMSSKKDVKCSECGKIREDLTNSLKCFIDSELVCDECFLYFVEKVRKWSKKQ